MVVRERLSLKGEKCYYIFYPENVRQNLVFGTTIVQTGLPRWLSGKDSVCNTGAVEDTGLIPGSGRSPGRRAWQPTPVFLPGESHGQRSLVGYSPWGHKESDLSEVT